MMTKNASVIPGWMSNAKANRILKLGLRDGKNSKVP